MSFFEILIKSHDFLFEPFIILIKDTFTVADVKKCLFCIFPHTEKPEKINIISSIELKDDQLISQVVAESSTEKFIFCNGAPCLMIKFDDLEDRDQISNYFYIHDKSSREKFVQRYVKQLEKVHANYVHNQALCALNNTNKDKDTRPSNRPASQTSSTNLINNVETETRSRQVPFSNPQQPDQPQVPNNDQIVNPPPPDVNENENENDPFNGVFGGVNEIVALRVRINFFGHNLVINPVNVISLVFRILLVYFLIFSQTSLVRLLLVGVSYLTLMMMWKVFSLAFQEQITTFRNFMRPTVGINRPSSTSQESLNKEKGASAEKPGDPLINLPPNRPTVIETVKIFVRQITVFVVGFVISLFPDQR